MPRQSSEEKKPTGGLKQKAARKRPACENSPQAAEPQVQAVPESIPQPDTVQDRPTRLNPLLLPNEDANKLNELTLAYYEHIRPANAAEASLVDLLIFSVWRGARLVAYEAELLANKAEDLAPTLGHTYQSISSTRLFALSFEAINDKGSANPTLNRYLVAARNAYHSTLSDIEKLRKIKGDAAQPFYQPSFAKLVVPIDLTMREPEPEPAPAPELYPEPEPEPTPAPASEATPEAPSAPSQPADSNQAEAPKNDGNIEQEEKRKSLMARAVPNPDAPYDPNTVWVHIIGPNGRPIADNYERPILRPVYIGPPKSQEPAGTDAKPSEGSKQPPEPKKDQPPQSNPFGIEIPSDLKTGN